MPNVKRPRVAAIHLDGPQLQSIEALCGELRAADSLTDYLGSYSWTETDVLILGTRRHGEVDASVNLLTLGAKYFSWSDTYGRNPVGTPLWHYSDPDSGNTERELRVPNTCPDSYKLLSAELSRQLTRDTDPPETIYTTRQGGSRLVETTSGLAVALRLALPNRSETAENGSSRPLALLLPAAANLGAWFHAFLSDVHEADPASVPDAPPRLSQPWDWFTPEERALADQIARVESDLERLHTERERLNEGLASEGERADAGIRRALWADGEELVTAVGEILANLGFSVLDMDLIRQGQPKREDLRLTLPNDSEWEAMAEVKGSNSGTKTNDTRQIREQRDLFIADRGKAPNLTLWLCNPHRTRDPSSRRSPGDNVREAAENIGAVHVLVPDLYKQWARVAAGELEAAAVIQSLVDAEPGLWTPPDAPSGS